MKYYVLPTDQDIQHHGILNQRWGVRNGPPYPLSGGQYTKSEKEAIKKKRLHPNSIYNKKHFDEVLKKDKTTLSTLSYNRNRTNDTDMFFATYKTLDKHQYNALFNQPISESIYDSNGNNIGTGKYLKFKINNSLNKDVKMASEDSASKGFVKLYNKDRDFYNFVNDDGRMQKYFDSSIRHEFKGYNEAKETLKKLDNKDYIPSEEELKRVYRLFNYTLPYDGKGNSREQKDILTQRAKFFNEMKKEGYGAILDTNDAIYGGFKASSPVIFFDMESVIPKNVYRTTVKDKRFSTFVTIGRKILSI